MSKLKTDYRGLFCLVGHRMSQEELLVLQSSVVAGCKKSREEFIYQMIPGANRISLRAYRLSGRRGEPEDYASIAYSAVVRAVDDYCECEIPMRSFVFYCVQMEMCRMSGDATRLKRTPTGSIIPLDTPEVRECVIDANAGPDEVAEKSIDLKIVCDLISRRLSSGHMHWRWLARYYGVCGNIPESQVAIGKSDNVTSQWVGKGVKIATQIIREELKIA